MEIPFPKCFWKLSKREAFFLFFIVDTSIHLTIALSFSTQMSPVTCIRMGGCPSPLPPLGCVSQYAFQSCEGIWMITEIFFQLLFYISLRKWNICSVVAQMPSTFFIFQHSWIINTKLNSIAFYIFVISVFYLKKTWFKDNDFNKGTKSTINKEMFMIKVQRTIEHIKTKLF